MKIKDIEEELKIVGATLFTEPQEGARNIKKDGFCIIKTEEANFESAFIIFPVNEGGITGVLKKLLTSHKPCDRIKE